MLSVSSPFLSSSSAPVLNRRMSHTIRHCPGFSRLILWAKSWPRDPPAHSKRPRSRETEKDMSLAA
jgi:hypothetical protein